jgi:serpin B
MKLHHKSGITVFGALAVGAALVVGAFACGDGSPLGPVEAIEGLPRALSLNEERLIDAGNDFSFRLLTQAYSQNPEENLLLAPLSASMALGMTLNGTAGNTLEEMRSTLGFGTFALAEINQGYRDLMDLLLNLDRHVDLGIGNSIWYHDGFSVRADFIERAQTYFDAEVGGLNFADPGAADVINAWVRGQTLGTIEEIVESPIDRGTVMFLINAMYFKGDWTVRFPKNKTEDATWEPRNLAWPPAIKLMQVTDTFGYAETESYQAVDLPYGGKAFSMTLILPRVSVGMADLVATFDAQSWADLTAGLTPTEGTVHLPRFRLEWEGVLNETLQAMGMEAAFDPQSADFSGLSDDPEGLYVSRVKQKTFLNVDEDGTEAGAATSVEISRESASFSFRADRPFLFMIRERFSETVLFAGVLNEPPAS